MNRTTRTEDPKWPSTNANAKRHTGTSSDAVLERFYFLRPVPGGCKAEPASTFFLLDAAAAAGEDFVIALGASLALQSSDFRQPTGGPVPKVPAGACSSGSFTSNSVGSFGAPLSSALAVTHRRISTSPIGPFTVKETQIEQSKPKQKRNSKESHNFGRADFALQVQVRERRRSFCKMMKRHFEYLTQPDQTLKDRSRFWTWYMRGLHGDMDTRYEGDRRLSRDRIAALAPKASNESGFNFRPMASNTYGYHPKGVAHLSKPPSAPDTSLAVDKPRKDWSTPLKNLDDVMTLREPQPRSSSVPRSIGSRPLIPARHLRHLPIDADLEGLLKGPLLWPRRGVANRLWRPHLFLDDTALCKPSLWINDPWWHKYPELRPLDLATSWSKGPSAMRNSYLSPVKRTYLWRSAHPLRPYGYHT